MTTDHKAIVQAKTNAKAYPVMAHQQHWVICMSGQNGAEAIANGPTETDAWTNAYHALGLAGPEKPVLVLPDKVWVATKHDFDSDENHNPHHSKMVAFAYSEAELDKWIATQPQGTYKGWNKEIYPKYTKGVLKRV